MNRGIRHYVQVYAQGLRPNAFPRSNPGLRLSNVKHQSAERHSISIHIIQASCSLILTLRESRAELGNGGLVSFVLERVLGV